MFNDKGFDKSSATEGTTVKIAPEAVSYTTSGLLDYSRNVVIGYLHKALKTANQLSMMEDALVIYRISRAPEEGYSISMSETFQKQKLNSILPMLCTNIEIN